MATKKEEQLSRMKALMNYGLQTESKQAPYSSVEFTKAASDSKTYGIIREGANFYIKVADTKPNLVKEDFNYIGGFRNRKDYQYDSFAKAQKNLELKLRSINEAQGNKSFSTETWDLEKKENVMVEATDKMKKEILRERQIMRNAAAINEKKEIDSEICATQKNNIKCGKPETGEPKDGVFTKDGEKELPKEMTEEVLAWHDSNGNPSGDHYMDKSHGTQIGDSAPFDDAKGKQITDNAGTDTTGEMKNGVVEEGASMHDSDNQNTPAPGTGEVGDDQPFDGEKGKQIDEATDIDDTVDDGEGEYDIDIEGGEGDDVGAEGGEGDDISIEDGEGDDIDIDIDDEPIDDDEIEGEGDDVFEDDLASRLDAIEELVKSMAEKLGVSAPAVDADNYEDDDIFDDGEDEDFGDEDGEDEYEVELEDDTDFEEPMPMESRRPVRIIESPRYKRLMEQKRRMNESGMESFTDAGRVPSGNMNKLNDFGKHPAYQKKVMELPRKDFNEFPGYYDMNDDSVRNDSPYGEKIGDGAPFEITPEKINNAISESIKKLGLKKK